MVRSTGSAEGAGDDAILKSSQKEPFEKRFEEARGEECQAGQGTFSLSSTHTRHLRWSEENGMDTTLRVGCPEEEEASWPHPQVLCPGPQGGGIPGAPVAMATRGCVAP